MPVPRRDERLPLVDDESRRSNNDKPDANDKPAAGSRLVEAIVSALACLVYLTVGPTLILVNRHILKVGACGCA
jgi:hypothetical protein